MPRRSHRSPRYGLRLRLAAWSARTFQPRQIILRSDDRVHALRLSPRVQKTAAAAALLAIAWSAGSGAALYWQADRMEGKRAELARAEHAYAELLDEVQRARSEVVELAAGMDATAGADTLDHLNRASEAVGRPSGGPQDTGLPMAIGRLQAALDGLAERNGRLSDQLSAAREDLAAARGRAEALERRRADLDARLARTEQALADARLSRSDLHDTLERLRARLNTAQTRRQADQQERLAAQVRIDSLERQLAAGARRAADARTRIADLEADLAASRERRQELVRERGRLASQVTRLETVLGERMPARGTLVQRIASLEQTLKATEARGARLAETRDRLSRRVASLETTLQQLRTRQASLVARATRRTRSGLDAMEQTVAMAGLDVDALVGRAGVESGGQGGPYVPVALGLPGSMDGDAAAQAVLDRQTRRLAALRQVLAAMPLTAPVDSFWISSDFGKRRDPYNGKWAMHEGLDLAATAGSPVLATAPGRVTFAGSKSGYGRMVEIDHGFGLTTRYAHLRSVSVQEGDRVDHRATVGALGSSGRSTGPHVHYEVLLDDTPLDPANFLEAGKHVFKG